jgi:hypothetical protein
LPDHIGGGILEYPLGGAVHRLDNATLVDGDNAVENIVDDGPGPALGSGTKAKKIMLKRVKMAVPY